MAATPRQTREPVIYVSNEKSNSITVIAARTDSVVATIAVGRRPRGMALSPDRKTAYVALGEDNAIGVIDVATRVMVKTLPVGIDPELLALAPDGKVVYVSNEETAHASGIVCTQSPTALKRTISTRGLLAFRVEISTVFGSVWLWLMATSGAVAARAD